MKSPANREAAIPGDKPLVNFFAALLTLSGFACTAVGQEFVPFVIPARINPEQPIWVTDCKPIKTDSERLSAGPAQRFHDGAGAVRIWA